MNKPLLILLGILQFGHALFSEIKCPSFFSDNMVLQRETKAGIWGWGEPNEKLIVTGSWGKSSTIQADSEGKWRGKIQTPKAGGPYTVTIKGSSELSFENVMIGEVWFCSGQSNMGTPMNKYYDKERIENEAKLSNIRLCRPFNKCTTEEQEDVPGKWTLSDFDRLQFFSACGYFFGRHLEQELDVPIGLIQAAWGGRRIETFTPWNAQKHMQYLVDDRAQRHADAKTWNQDIVDTEFQKEVEEWEKEVEEWETGGQINAKPRKPRKKDHPLTAGRYPSGNYNGMVHPFLGYGIKGVIWYQGEANSQITGKEDDPSHYDDMLERLITSWRERWQIGDFPFYWVQLPDYTAPWKKPAELSQPWPIIRESMLHAHFKIPNTAVAVAMGLGEEKDIHPHMKKEVGDRLALIAMHNEYGKKNIAWCGPLAKECEFQGNKVIVNFENGGAPLQFSGKDSYGFAVKDQKGTLTKAKAKIIGTDKLEITSDSEIKEVFYAWANNPKGANLENKGNLPASPFRFVKE